MNVTEVSNNRIKVIQSQDVNETIIPKKEQTITDIAYLCLKSPFLWTFSGVAVSWYVFPLTASLILTATVVCGMAAADLHKAADFIQTNKDGIYIHYKAGRGRSVMYLMAYLMKYEKLSYEEAEKFVRCKRPVTSLKSCQKEMLQKFSLEIESMS